MAIENYFEIKLQVNIEHIDRQQHVNNVVYLQWIQDVSEAHWTTMAPQQLQQNYFWVALRHEIDYKAQAFLGDIILAKTKIVEMEGFRSIRQVEIFNESTGKLLCKSLTHWCLMNTHTQKPCRMNPDFTELLFHLGFQK